MKQNQPVAFCTVCGEYSNNVAAINQPHHRTKNGDKCKGCFSSALSENDWKECSECGTTGRIDGKRCEVCQGSGWILMRHSR